MDLGLVIRCELKSKTPFLGISMATSHEEYFFSLTGLPK
jgi:hypothetical protein